jgi:hypothetical protein
MRRLGFSWSANWVLKGKLCDWIVSDCVECRYVIALHKKPRNCCKILPSDSPQA